MIPARWEKCKKEPENRQKGILPRCGWDIGIVWGYQGGFAPFDKVRLSDKCVSCHFRRKWKKKRFLQVKARLGKVKERFCKVKVRL